MRQTHRRRTAESLRAAARVARLDGDEELADLLEAIASAHAYYQRLDLVPLDEALRWSPVIVAALKIAKEYA